MEFVNIDGLTSEQVGELIKKYYKPKIEPVIIPYNLKNDLPHLTEEQCKILVEKIKKDTKVIICE